LQEDTGAIIDVDRDSGTVSIRGSSAESVEKCKALIEKLIEGAQSSGAGSGGAGASGADGDSIERRVKIDKGSIGAVIGSGASVVRKIESESGAALTIDRVR
jgi:polyribonucleotide nucleotidyltransferase